eukprot:m.156257 g.156257  ORF g.156257 m.156257 type:complete len:943 (+) comp16437_c0_seq1:76-2904(+)
MMQSLKGKLNRVRRGGRKRSSQSAQEALGMHELAYLQALRCDLADWFNVVLSRDDITGDSFVQRLQSGILLCHVARVIESTHTKWALEHQTPWKPSRVKCNDKAVEGSFFARDNILSFLNWCAKFGGEGILFDCDDLIDGRHEEAVLHCLHHLARNQRGVIAPMLVRAEEAVNGTSCETLQDVLGDTTELNKAICSGVRAAGYDPESVMIEPDDKGLFYLGSEVQPCCLALAGGLAMIKVAASTWMTLTRYILEYWGAPVESAPTPGPSSGSLKSSRSPKSPHKSKRVANFVDAFNGMARRKSQNKLQRASSGSLRLRRSSSRSNSGVDLLSKKRRPSSEIILRPHHANYNHVDAGMAATPEAQVTIASDLDVMDAAAMSELINACVHDDNEDADDMDDDMDDEGGYQQVPDDFDPLAELDDDFDPLAECSEEESPSVSSNVPVQVARPVAPPTPPKHTKPALVRTILQADPTHNDDIHDNDDSGDSGFQAVEPEALTNFQAGLRRASSLATEGTGGDLPLPRHLRNDGSTTALTTRTLTSSTNPSPGVSRTASSDELGLQAGRRVSAVDVSHLGKSLPLPKKLRKTPQSETAVVAGKSEVTKSKPTTTTIMEKPSTPTKPAQLTLKNEGVMDYYGSREALQAPAKPAKPLKPALIGRSLKLKSPAGESTTDTAPVTLEAATASKPVTTKPDTVKPVAVKAAGATTAQSSATTTKSTSKPTPALRKPSPSPTPSDTNVRRSPRRKSPVRIASGASMRPVSVQEGHSTTEVQLLTVELGKYKEQVERLTQENAKLQVDNAELERAACEAESVGDQQVQDLEAKLELSHEMCTEFEEQLLSHQMDIVGLKERELASKVAQDEAEELRRQVKAMKEELLAEKARHGQRIAAVSVELHDLKVENERLQQEVTSIQNKDIGTTTVVLDLPNYGPVRVALSLEASTSL